MQYTVLTLSLLAVANARVLVRDSTPQTISGWSSMGCYTDSQKDRTLTNLVGVGEDVSNTQCQAKCASLGYLYAGNEFGGQCYCDNSIHSAIPAPPDCNMTCPGDATQTCGQADRINLFYNGPSQQYNVPGWTSYGCMTDDVSHRALSHSIHADNMTPQVCASACANLGYTLSGVEYSSECYCDNYIQNNQTLAKPSDCNMACAGDSSLACGGPGRINVFYSGNPPTAQTYKSHDIALPSGWKAAGCYSDAVSNRALASWIVGPESGMTVEYCVSGCAASNYTFAGVENGNECYCGLQIDNSQQPATDGCTTPCSGDNSETCGGPNRLNMYSAYTAAPKQCSNQGLQYAAYSNPYYNGPDVSKYTDFSEDFLKQTSRLLYSDVTTTMGGIYDDCSNDNSISVYGSSKTIPCTYHALNHRGYIYAPVTGAYTFTISSVDDIVLFWTGSKALSGWTRANADGQVVYNTGNNCNWSSGWHPGCGSFTFNMNAGQYLPIRIVFGQAQGASTFQLALHGPDGRDLLDSNSVGSQYVVQYSCDGTSAPAFPSAFGYES